jgi:hypothetical protein
MKMKIKQIVLSLLATTAMAQSAGKFTTTGSMTTPRFGHTATLLADGRVLIVGGYTDENAVEVPRARTASAELYDPASGTFRPTGNMIVPRANHTATLLPDGRVLIAGGVAVDYGVSAWASAELYDPTTGTFAPTANMAVPRSDHTATLLLDGRVLIVGGIYFSFDSITDYYSTAELYDPVLNTFTVTTNMVGTPVTLLSDGRVLLAGSPWASTPASTLYDPRTGAVKPTGGNMLLTDHATLLPNGKILVAGGNNDPGPSPLAEEYDPSNGMFNRTGSMTAPRANYTATLLPDGKALIAGGRTWIHTTFSGEEGVVYFCCTASADLYDPSTRTFTSTGSMTTPRNYHTATVLLDGRVLIAGGSGDSSIAALATAELYHPEVPGLAPLLFSLASDGRGQGAIQHAGTDRIASAEDPAVAGEYLSIYLTGLGDGSVIPPQVVIGGRSSTITFFGTIAGYSGLNQVNVRVPGGLAPGPAVPVRLTYLGRASNEVTIGVQ